MRSIYLGFAADVEISGLSFSMAINLFAVRVYFPITQSALPTIYCQLCSRLHHRPFHFVASLSRRLRDVTAHNCLIFLQLRSWEFNFLDELPMVFLSSSFSGRVTAEAGFDYFEASLPPIHLYIHGFVAHGIDIFLELYQRFIFSGIVTAVLYSVILPTVNPAAVHHRLILATQILVWMYVLLVVLFSPHTIA